MAVKHAEATWTGTLDAGAGTMKLGSYGGDMEYTKASRFGDEANTNPEELVGAAHAGCFSMFLSAVIGKAGFTPERIHTTATVHLTDGPTISKIELTVDATVPGIDRATFDELVATSRKGCPVSKALAGGPEISVDATLHA